MRIYIYLFYRFSKADGGPVLDLYRASEHDTFSTFVWQNSEAHIA